ncbi:unnamed protein product [Chondrus crispus]|uniref:aminodeoxychorismate synthase n=1 Tax=Chondrus crispus TaxID=2769 RepID=R7QQ14_CHOCR|nr:unnamed protein product [Chondrus crispus]CDF39868.1 unnamed protein product [Chondrus crispus]|eukprot:XP_005710162.1 unnamed protein product [Chondrus crispus]
MRATRLALIDNYDSYTHNLAHLVSLANGPPPTVIRADAYPTLSALTQALGNFDGYILSPGPGTPLNDNDFPQLERDILQGSTPMLGVCLGHQALCAAYGMEVGLSPAGPVHGGVSTVTRAPTGHDCPLLTGLPHSFRAVRYHSLAASSCHTHFLKPTAWTVDRADDGTIHQILMAVRHRTKPLFGVQFHPESVSSEYGLRLVTNFVNIVRACRRPALAPCPTPPVAPTLKPVTQGTANYRTLLHQVRYLSVSSEQLFVGLYGKESEAFWLDSSNAVPLGSGMSRCSSPELPPDPPHNCNGGEETPSAAPTSENDQEKSSRGRFSLMGACTGPLSETITYDVHKRLLNVRTSTGSSRALHDTTIFEYLQSCLSARYAPQHPDLPIDMNGGYVGFFGYELKKDTPGVKRNEHESTLPDAWFLFADQVLVIDHEENSFYMVAVVPTDSKEHYITAYQWFNDVRSFLENPGDVEQPVNGLSAFSPDRLDSVLQFVPERTRSSYLEDIRRCLFAIETGESYEVCLTNRLRTVLPGTTEADPLHIYRALRLINPAPYAAYLRLSSDVAVCCASPERFLQIDSTCVVTSKPIKGTLPRGRTLQEDEALRTMLQNSEKDRRENLMIVDLVRNDLSRTCAVGSVQVPRLMHVESYASVHQLVTTVTGVLNRPGDALKCIQAAYPMGSMTGAPKVRTMEIIDELENSPRGIYSGSIGYLSLSGAADLNVVIRTAVVNANQVEIGVGGAIIALSSPAAEYEELILKGGAIMRAVALQSTGREDYVVLHEHSKMP